MREFIRDNLQVLASDSQSWQTSSFTEDTAHHVIRFHRSLPAYHETELVDLKAAAEKYGVEAIFAKDESSRFGLKAFKGLGGSYAVFRILCEKLSLDPSLADFRDFERREIREKCSHLEFATATDGNHGKGVSWAAGQFGCKAHVFMPAGTVEARRKAIEEAGSAVAEITPYNYDGTVAHARKLADQNGWILTQDTALEGYEQIPQWIMEGYLTLGKEALNQMDGKRPTHVFLQAGVGSMAAAMAAYLANVFPENPPLVTIVEPTEAACFYQSARAGDGLAHTVEGNPVTIMAGLNCGTPCRTIWPLLRDGTSFYCACSDAITERGMRAYARPEGNDRKVVAGESGAVTYGLLLTILEDEELRRIFRIGPESVILLINTEGDTDPEDYRRVISLETAE